MEHKRVTSNNIQLSTYYIVLHSTMGKHRKYISTSKQRYDIWRHTTMVRS